MKLSYLIILITIVTLTTNTISAQQFIDNTLTHDNEQREYRIYIPENYDGANPVPLMFNFHGGSGDIDSQVAIADMSAIADTANFIVVYPQALPDPNDGGSTNWLHKDPTDVDEVFFVDAMIDSIAALYAIDQTRIYACGYSLGGELTYELACRLNERIAAIGAVARTMGTAAFDNCAPVHPTGVLTILGTDDSISPYDGLTWMGIQFYLSADEMHNYWADQNNTAMDPIITQLPDMNPSDGSSVERYTWENGDNCVTVQHLKVNGGGHDWPGSFGNRDIDASLEIWNYVSQFDLNGRINCDATTTEEIVDIPNITIYPNPTSETLTVDLNIETTIDYQILSTMGEQLLSGQIESSQKSIDLSSVPASIYFIKIGSRIMKFYKQ